MPEIASITGHSLDDVNAMLDRHYLGHTNALAESASPSWNGTKRV